MHILGSKKAKINQIKQALFFLVLKVQAEVDQTLIELYKK